MTKFVELFFRFLIAPIAVGAGLFGRYGTGIEIIEIAWPMVIIFLVCYLIHSIIETIVSQTPNFSESKYDNSNGILIRDKIISAKKYL